MRSIHALSLLAIGLAFGVTACSDTTATGDPLTDAEATELAGMIVSQGFAGFGDVTSGPALAPGAAENTTAKITVTINQTGPCDGGGTAALNGTLTANIDTIAKTGTLGFDYTIAPNGCEVTSRSGVVFALTGDPNLAVGGDFSFGNNTFTGSLSYDGKFLWEASDGRSGG
jgi:hypothetical protein